METESGRSGQFTNEQGQFLLACSTVLFDRYRVLKIIHHRGQSATIILAKDTQRDRQVVIKALHAHSVWFNIGLQEARILRQLANADPHKFSRTARLLDVFVYDSHICLVFDALNPKPITQVFKGSSYTHEEKLKNLRKMTLQLLQVAGFLRQNHVIHADLKPENILFKDVTDLNTMKVVDFGNAIRLRSEELALYHEHFEVQSPLYRAPEVFFGLPFYAEIDMWSIGCILAELYLGKPLIRGTTRVEMVQSMRDVLGPLPRGEFCKGKFYPLLQEFTHHDVDKGHVAVHLFKAFKKLTSQVDHNFVHLLAGLLEYDPAERLTPHQAALHPFLAPEICLSYLMPQHSERLKPGQNKGRCQKSVTSSTPPLDPRKLSPKSSQHHTSSEEAALHTSTALIDLSLSFSPEKSHHDTPSPVKRASTSADNDVGCSFLVANPDETEKRNAATGCTDQRRDSFEGSDCLPIAESLCHAARTEGSIHSCFCKVKRRGSEEKCPSSSVCSDNVTHSNSCKKQSHSVCCRNEHKAQLDVNHQGCLLCQSTHRNAGPEISHHDQIVGREFAGKGDNQRESGELACSCNQKQLIKLKYFLESYSGNLSKESEAVHATPNSLAVSPAQADINCDDHTKASSNEHQFSESESHDLIQKSRTMCDETASMQTPSDSSQEPACSNCNEVLGSKPTASRQQTRTPKRSSISESATNGLLQKSTIPACICKSGLSDLRQEENMSKHDVEVTSNAAKTDKEASVEELTTVAASVGENDTGCGPRIGQSGDTCRQVLPHPKHCIVSGNKHTSQDLHEKDKFSNRVFTPENPSGDEALSFQPGLRTSKSAAPARHPSSCPSDRDILFPSMNSTYSLQDRDPNQSMPVPERRHFLSKQAVAGTCLPSIVQKTSQSQGVLNSTFTFVQVSDNIGSFSGMRSPLIKYAVSKTHPPSVTKQGSSASSGQKGEYLHHSSEAIHQKSRPSADVVEEEQDLQHLCMSSLSDEEDIHNFSTTLHHKSCPLEEEEGLCQLSEEEGEDIQLPSFIHQEMHPSEEEEDLHQLSASSGEESEDLHQLPGILHQKAMPPEDEEEICQLSAPSEEEEEDGQLLTDLHQKLRSNEEMKNLHQQSDSPGEEEEGEDCHRSLTIFLSDSPGEKEEGEGLHQSSTILHPNPCTSKKEDRHRLPEPSGVEEEDLLQSSSFLDKSSYQSDEEDLHQLSASSGEDLHRMSIALHHKSCSSKLEGFHRALSRKEVGIPLPSADLHKKSVEEGRISVPKADLRKQSVKEGRISVPDLHKKSAPSEKREGHEPSSFHLQQQPPASQKDTSQLSADCRQNHEVEIHAENESYSPQSCGFEKRLLSVPTNSLSLSKKEENRSDDFIQPKQLSSVCYDSDSSNEELNNSVLRNLISKFAQETPAEKRREAAAKKTKTLIRKKMTPETKRSELDQRLKHSRHNTKSQLPPVVTDEVNCSGFISTDHGAAASNLFEDDILAVHTQNGTLRNRFSAGHSPTLPRTPEEQTSPKTRTSSKKTQSTDTTTKQELVHVLPSKEPPQVINRKQGFSKALAEREVSQVLTSEGTPQAACTSGLSQTVAKRKRSRSVSGKGSRQKMYTKERLLLSLAETNVSPFRKAKKRAREGLKSKGAYAMVQRLQYCHEKNSPSQNFPSTEAVPASPAKCAGGQIDKNKTGSKLKCAHKSVKDCNRNLKRSRVSQVKDEEDNQQSQGKRRRSKVVKLKKITAKSRKVHSEESIENGSDSHSHSQDQSKRKAPHRIHLNTRSASAEMGEKEEIGKAHSEIRSSADHSRGNSNKDETSMAHTENSKPETLQSAKRRRARKKLKYPAISECLAPGQARNHCTMKSSNQQRTETTMKRKDCAVTSNCCEKEHGNTNMTESVYGKRRESTSTEKHCCTREHDNGCGQTKRNNSVSVTNRHGSASNAKDCLTENVHRHEKAAPVDQISLSFDRQVLPASDTSFSPTPRKKKKLTTSQQTPPATQTMTSEKLCPGSKQGFTKISSVQASSAMRTLPNLGGEIVKTKRDSHYGHSTTPLVLDHSPPASQVVNNEEPAPPAILRVTAGDKVTEDHCSANTDSQESSDDEIFLIS